VPAVTATRSTTICISLRTDSVGKLGRTDSNGRRYLRPKSHFGHLYLALDPHDNLPGDMVTDTVDAANRYRDEVFIATGLFCNDLT